MSGSDLGAAKPGTLTSILDPGDFGGTFATGQAKKVERRQRQEIARQKKIEDQKLAEADSEVKRRQALGTKSRAGRRSLIATSETGLATKLGGA